MTNKIITQTMSKVMFTLSSKMSSKLFFYSPTDAQVNCHKNSFKIYVKIDIKTAPTCFGVITIICSDTTELTTPMYFN
jgi:hypothetical protein